jgi:hypothetical protein
VSVFLGKKNVQVLVRIQRRTVRIQRQLSQPNFTKDPKRKKDYNQVPKSFGNRRCSKSSSPATAVEEDNRHHFELEKPHRTLAFEGVEVDTCLIRWDEAVGDRPSTGAAPQALQLVRTAQFNTILDESPVVIFKRRANTHSCFGVPRVNPHLNHDDQHDIHPK